MTLQSAPFAALATSVSSTLFSRSLSKAVEMWENTALEISSASFPFTESHLDEKMLESIRAAASIAVYDAIHSILGEGVGIFYKTPSAATSSLAAEAAVSQAAHDVLAHHFTDPLNQMELWLLLSRRMSNLPDSYQKTQGRATGAASAAAAITASRLGEAGTRKAA